MKSVSKNMLIQEEFNAVAGPQFEEDPIQNFSAEAKYDKQMKKICNFTCSELMIIYNFVCILLEIAHKGGRRSYYAPNAIFLITLNYLKSAMDFPQMQVQFGFTDTYMAMIVNETTDIL